MTLLMKERKHILDQLLNLERPVKDIVAELARFGWDSSERLSLLCSRHISAVLIRYLARELSSSEVEEWASALEGRDDIALDDAQESFIRETVHELANPLITRTLDTERARELLAMIAILEE